MNGEKNFYEKIINGDFNELGAISICFEDATRDSEVENAENNVVNMLDNLVKYIDNIEVINNIPLIFFRVRNYNQFLRFTSKLRTIILDILLDLFSEIYHKKFNRLS